jgi:hypothetical protein
MTPRKQQALAKAQRAAALARHREAVEAARPLLPLVRRLRRRGWSYQRIADHLNEQGHRTRRGKRFFPAQVWSILARADAGRRRQAKAAAE